jgi:hypothetical protein
LAQTHTHAAQVSMVGHRFKGERRKQKKKENAFVRLCEHTHAHTLLHACARASHFFFFFCSSTVILNKRKKKREVKKRRQTEEEKETPQQLRDPHFLLSLRPPRLPPLILLSPLYIFFSVKVTIYFCCIMEPKGRTPENPETAAPSPPHMRAGIQRRKTRRAVFIFSSSLFTSSCTTWVVVFLQKKLNVPGKQNKEGENAAARSARLMRAPFTCRC